MKYVRRSLSIVLAFVLTFTYVYVSAADDKPSNGYNLVPLISDAAGVDTDSSFLLTAPHDITVSELEENLTLENEPPLVIEQSGELEFTVTPSVKLPSNSIITFRLNCDNDELTWMFQTADKFRITSTLPYDTATNVPIDSGIEVEFSNDAYGDINFEIEPYVEGRFERHGRTISFIPQKPLDYMTVYTVTVKAGTVNTYTNEIIDEDLVFSFETEAEESDDVIGMSFWNSYYTKSTEDDLTFGLLHGLKGDEVLNTDISVYKFSSDAAVEYLGNIGKHYRWSMYNSDDSVDTSGLERIAAFKYKDVCNDENRIITLQTKLAEGFYVVEADYEGHKAETIVQISDLPVSVIGSADGTDLVWVNDVKTGKSCANAVVSAFKTGTEYRTDSDGIAKIENSELAEGFKVSANGRQFYMPSGIESDAYKTAEDDNLSVLRLDRTLFKKEDTVSFWGFAKAKNGGAADCVTVALEQYGRILSKQRIKTDNGVYSGAFELPALDAGRYTVSVYLGADNTEWRNYLSSQGITVSDYAKPPYKIEIESDKKAVFDGDKVNYTIKSEFFEGTPVADTEISYHLFSDVSGESKNGTGVTDANGEIHLSEAVSTQYYGRQGYVSLSAEAVLPEVGTTYTNNAVSVFTSDIDVDVDAVRNSGRGTISAEVNSITLDRLNNGTAKDFNDYIDSPVDGKELTADIYRVYYTSKQIDTGYDYIEKKSYPIYDYERHEEKIDSVHMITDADGMANAEVRLSGNEHDSYYAKISFTDRRGRQISIDRYIGIDYTAYYEGMRRDSYYLDGIEDNYKIGDDVNLKLMRGADEVKKGSFLYVTVGGGIFEYSAENTYSRKFDENMAPNVNVYCYYFDGRKYQHGYRMNRRLTYGYSEKELNIELTFDKEQYLPGDECSITIKTSDSSGSPKSAAVCLSAVDRALLELENYEADTAAQLYAYRYYSPAVVFMSHSEEYSYRNTVGGSGGGWATSVETAAANDSVQSASLKAGEGEDIRSDFKDTAMFAAINTDADGKAEYHFALPDNITSWRLTASAVTDDLHAGDSVADLTVSKPMFINYTLNNEFLVGDEPSVGVSVYGSELSGGDKIQISVWSEDEPDNIIYASGAALSRVNISLPQMNEAGEFALIIRAESGGRTDIVRHEYSVYSTYQSMQRAVYAEAYPGMSFETADSGMSNIIFTDKGRGQYLSTLYDLTYTHGARIEKIAAAREADRLIEKYFPDVYRCGTKKDFDFRDYQSDDGGMAILPYASSNLELTVKILPYIKDSIDEASLKEYLNNAYNGDNVGNKFAALYGLAVMGEPVLNDLDRYAEVQNLGLRDSIYLALAYNAFGKEAKAAEIYSRDIAPNIVSAEPYCYINTGDSKDGILELTSLAMQTAAQLEMPENEGMYRYCIDNYADDILINLEKLTYIKSAIENADPQDSYLTYEYMGDTHTVDLKNGSSFALRIPNKYIQYFKLTDVNGTVSTVSLLPEAVNPAGADPEVTVRRRYYSVNDTENSTYEFKQGDLIRVNLWIDYTNKAVDGSYHITDYLPSGLEFADNSAKIEPQFGDVYGSRFMHCKADGQKVEFYDYNGRFDSGVLYYYYARVVSPGEFTAEGTMVQNAYSPDIFTVGQNDRIAINE